MNSKQYQKYLENETLSIQYSSLILNHTNISTMVTLKVNRIISFPNTRGISGNLDFEFGYIVVTESPETETVSETWRWHCLLGCARSCQGRGYVPRNPPGVDIACMPLQIWTLLHSSCVHWVPVATLLP